MQILKKIACGALMAGNPRRTPLLAIGPKQGGGILLKESHLGESSEM